VHEFFQALAGVLALRGTRPRCFGEGRLFAACSARVVVPQHSDCRFPSRYADLSLISLYRH